MKIPLLPLVVAALVVTPLARAASAAPTPALVPDCRALGLSSCPQPYDRVLPKPAGMLSWDPASRIVGFRNGYRLYPGDVFATRGAPPFPLPAATRALPPLHYAFDGHSYRLEDYLRHQRVTGFLILKSGRIAYEYYGHGNTATTLWTSRSVAKSVVSVLVGIALAEGKLRSVSDPITRYLPELTGTAWDGVTLHELLQHTSGIAWNEDYADPASDFARLTRCEATADAYGCVLELIRSRPRKPGVAPGEEWSYNTGGAWLVGLLLERATGMTIARYLETRLWSRFAMEHDGVWHALKQGEVDMGGHGFNATLRDWGRFALFVARGGTLANGEALLPADWLARSTTWTQARGSVTPAAPAGQYGYQWWYAGVDPRLRDAEEARAIAARSFWAEGIYGQTIAVDPADELVMVQWSVWDHAETPAALYDEQAVVFAAIEKALRPAH